MRRCPECDRELPGDGDPDECPDCGATSCASGSCGYCDACHARIDEAHDLDR